MKPWIRTGLARLKAIISAVEDKYRPPYGRAEITQRRLAVLVGTTNTNNYLRDDSGNTRFLPIKCGEVNVIALAAARDQLFAEAMAERAKTPGQEWWQAPADIWKSAQDEQEARYTPDPWEEPMSKWLNSRSHERVTVAEVLRLCLRITADKVDQKHANRVARIFQRLGWERVRRWDGEGNRRWAYEKV